ncbi:MAG: hypothetical protein FWH01_15630, partial [Oscillospiraceae bacterium]|nr:hypothetical protein [Oscillospiraceae bacterium]
GSDFRFGRAGGGDVTALRRFGAQYGFGVEEVFPETIEGQGLCGRAVIGSTAIRAAVASGRLETAASMLGRLFSLTCRVDSCAMSQTAPGYMEAVAFADARMATPAPGAYIITTRPTATACTAGALGRGFAIIAEEASQNASQGTAQDTSQDTAQYASQGTAQDTSQNASQGKAQYSTHGAMPGVVQSAAPAVKITCYVQNYAGDLHKPEIDIFFYKKIFSTVGGVGCELRISEVLECAAASERYFVSS